MVAQRKRTIRNVVIALVVAAASVTWAFGGCAAGGGNGPSDDDDGTITPTATTTGGGTGATAGTGGQAAAGGVVGGTGGGLGGTGGVAGSGGSGAMGGAGGGGPCGYGNPVCFLYHWDFDSGCPAGWTPSGNNSDWACGAPTWGVTDDCEGGGNVWATSLNGNSANCQSSYLTSPSMDLSAYQGQTVLFGFYHSYDFRECNGACTGINWMCYSGGRIEVNSGGGWTVVQPQGGYENPGLKTVMCGSGAGGSPSCGGAVCDLDNTQVAYTCAGTELVWHQALVDLSSHLSADVRVRFVFGNGETVPVFFPDKAGWYIDNIAVLIPGACP